MLDGAIEAELISDLLAAMGASVVRAKAEDAERLATAAAENGRPFSAFVTDKANVEVGAARLLSLLRGASPPDRALRAVVTIDPSERGDIARFRAEGFNGYLVRPVRPLSSLTQLFDRTAQQDAKPTGLKLLQLPASGANAISELAVLLAEDNDINALLACTVLEKSGARVVRACDGADAIAKAENELANSGGSGFDLVLMDIHMPDMDGVEAAQRIRALYPEEAEPGVGRPPIVALTANAFAEDQAAYLAAGLDDYLAKPFEKQDLSALLSRWHGESARADRADTGAA